MSGISAAIAHMVNGRLAAVRRSAIGYVICAACGIAVLILATGAGVLSLVPVVGAVYALLIAAGVYAVVIAGTLLWLNRTAQPASAAPQRVMPAGAVGVEAMQRQMQTQQLTMIIEAVMLGYSLSRRR